MGVGKLQMAAMQQHDAMHDRQAQARATALAIGARRGKKALPQPVHQGTRYARARILHRQPLVVDPLEEADRIAAMTPRVSVAHRGADA